MDIIFELWTITCVRNRWDMFRNKAHVREKGIYYSNPGVHISTVGLAGYTRDRILIFIPLLIETLAFSRSLSLTSYMKRTWDSDV